MSEDAIQWIVIVGLALDIVLIKFALGRKDD